MDNSRSTIHDKQVALAIALLLLAVYLTTTALRFQSIDEVATFSLSRSLIGHGGIDGDILFWRVEEMGRGAVVARGVDGHYHVVKDVAPSILGIPLVWLAHLLDVSPVRSILLLPAIVTALTGALIFHLVRLWDYSRATALLSALTYGLATLAWPYAETIFTQPVAALGLVIAIMGTEHAYQSHNWAAALLAGLGLGLAGASAVPTWITGPLYALYLIPWETLRQQDWRSHIRHWLPSLIAFGAGAGLILVALGFYNWMRFGVLLDGHHQTETTAWLNLLYLPNGLFGQLLSTPRGLLWYMPVVILAPIGVVISCREKHVRTMLLPLAQSGLLLLLYSAFTVWSGGLNWGPRYLIPIVPALTLLSVPLLDRLTRPGYIGAKVAIGSILLISLATQLLAGLFDNLAQEPQIFPLLIDYALSPDFPALDPFLFDPQWLPQTSLLRAVQHGDWDTLWMATGRPDGLLLGADLALMLLAVTWAALAAGQKWLHLVTGGLIAQAGLSLGVTLLMLTRYPSAPGEFSPRQTFYPENLDELAATLTAVVEPGDGVVVLLPYSYLRWVDSYDEPAPDFGVPLESPVSPATAELLELASQSHSRLWLVTEIPNNHPQNGTENWLSEHGFVGNTIWVGGYRIVAFTLEQRPLTLRDSRHMFGSDELALIGYAVEAGRGPWLNVWLRWEALQEVEDYYIVTVQLLNESGVLVAQHDSAPSNSYAPTSMWSTDQIVDDRHSVALPADLPPGAYRLAVALYRISDGERLPLADGSGDLALVGLIELPASD